MKTLNICIDIDGTITDPYFLIDPCNKFFNKNITRDDVTQFNMEKVLNISKKDFMDFYDQFKFEIHWEQEIIPDAKKVIDNLSKNHNIYFVTARDKSLTLLTRSYLDYHNFKYDELYVLGSHYKVPKANQLDCDLFIEDSYSNAIELSEAGFKVLLIDTNYNRLPINHNIIRVHNWNEINEVINKLLLQASNAM
ncbi:MAG: hypothetical protein GX323_00320 [Clostridiales bacterium]|nr:hypothetical protein [Clostridiales bacterium]